MDGNVRVDHEGKVEILAKAPRITERGRKNNSSEVRKLTLS